jgi:hypothetical protein
MGWRSRLAERFFGDIIRSRVEQAVRVVDDRWWAQLGGSAAPQDRAWHDLQGDLAGALEAWRANPLAFRIVSLTTDFVVGEGLLVRSRLPRVQEFLDRFWTHRLNRIPLRLERWCDELTRSGELFLVLSTNPADGMSYVREVPAARIDRIDTDPADLERELRYHELDGTLEGRWWPGPGAEDALTTPQLMLHYSINRPVGALRGQGDLAPILPWLRRYKEWLEDRARINRFKGAFLWQVTVRNAGPGVLERKRAQYMRPPAPGSVIITDESEEWRAVHPAIEAADASPDGRAMRLMVAAGAGIPLHFLAEGESANRATAREMGAPTFRHYDHRRREFGAMLVDLSAWAVRRARSQLGGEVEAELGLYWQAVGGGGSET